MRRVLLIAAAVMVARLVRSQLLVPPYLEHRAEKRLTAHGGRATVSIDALPAARLLFDDGDKIKVRGDGLHVNLFTPSSGVFNELDRFDRADVRLTRMTAGPLAEGGRGRRRRSRTSRPPRSRVGGGAGARTGSHHRGAAARPASARGGRAQTGCGIAERGRERAARAPGREGALPAREAGRARGVGARGGSRGRARRGRARARRRVGEE